MKTILIFMSVYLPGYRAGGPIRTVANIVDALGDEFHFKLVTSDRDFEMNAPYPGIALNRWTVCGKAEVCYLSRERCTFSNIRRILLSTEYDLLYLQSLWSQKFTLFPVLNHFFSVKGGKFPVLLAPRGECSLAALKKKSLKKRFGKMLYSIFGLPRNISFHASTEMEKEQIRDYFGRNIEIYTALDLPSSEHTDKQFQPKEDLLKLCYLARIHRHKNLHWVLNSLNEVAYPVRFDVYGTVEDQEYWGRCKKIIESLPSHIHIDFKGSISPDHVIKTLEQYDIFCMPSQSENFGHSIHEALRSGTPVLISDQCPWPETESRNAGWIIDLLHPEKIAECMNQYYHFTGEQKIAMHKNALKYGMDVSMKKEPMEKMKMIFQTQFDKFKCKKN